MLHGNKRRDAGNGTLKSPHSQATPRLSPQQQQGLHAASDQQSGHRTQRPSAQHNMPGKKRKAREHPNQRPAQRRAAPPLKDEAYIRSNFKVPTKHDYPELPPATFKNVKSSVANAVQGLVELRSDFVSLAADAFQCTLRFKSTAQSEVVIGEGRTKRSAEEAAYLHLVAVFHERGILGDIMDRKSDLNQINKTSVKQEREEERDAITDIYNYAARFDLVPETSTKFVQIIHRGRPKKYIDLKVNLKEQGIAVTGRGSDYISAVVDAGKRFKEKAEQYHAERGSDAIIIKDSGALTTENVSKFLDFYKIFARPGINIEVESQTPTKMAKANLWRFQAKINGEYCGEPVEMGSKKSAEVGAYLTASLEIKKKEPELYPRFLKALRAGHGQILKPVSPIDFEVDEDCSLIMRETLVTARKAGLPDEVEELLAESATPDQAGPGHHYRKQLTAQEIKLRNWLLTEKMDAYLQDEKIADLRRKKAELPMNQYRSKVLELINNNFYSIVVGATGSGKTTQVPQILLENAIAEGQGATCNIICTQPRRIAATSVARRVSEERVGMQQTVGYHVRFDAKLPQPGGSVTYCTTGILLQQLQHNPDEVMDCNTHLVIDEVHERDMQIDFLLILLKQVTTQRRAQGKSTPRIVLMSATMDTELFASYFKSPHPEKGSEECPSLTVPGRTFPVKERYLDDIVKDLRASSSSSELQAMYLDRDSKDYLAAEERHRVENPTGHSQEISDASRDEVAVIDWKRERKYNAEDGSLTMVDEKENALVPLGLVACTIAHVAKTTQEGAILVFLPGLAEILKVEEILMQHKFGINFSDQSKFKIFQLHSSIATSQSSVFEQLPEGCRKIILATNIAETSVTIPDVQYVVDTGKLRETQYDQQRRISQLVCTWVSKSNAKQRAGRAGRVQNGNYYALYTKQRYDSLRAIGLPELLRVDLQDICLTIKAQAFKMPLREFLAEALEPPSVKAVDTAVVNLQALDALTDEEEITPLGRLLSSLPVHPALGKMIVLGIIFRCLDPMLILGAASEGRQLFLSPIEARQEARAAKASFVEGSGSDHIALLNAVRKLHTIREERGEREMRDFAHRQFLHLGAFKTIESTVQQILEILVTTGLVSPTRGGRSGSSYGHPTLNTNSHKVSLIKALFLAGVHPNLAVTPSGGPVYRTAGERATIIHPQSVNAVRDDSNRRDRAKAEPSVKPGTLYSYGTMARSNDGNSLFLRDTTECTPLMATLFGGKLQRVATSGNILEVDSWLPFYVTSFDRRTAKTVLEFRKALERLLAMAFKDLGQLSFDRIGRRSRYDEGRKTFLADEKVCEFFAGGLVEVLDRDIKKNAWTSSRMSSNRRYGSGIRRRDHGARSDGVNRYPRDAGRTGTAQGAKMPGFYQDMMKI